MAQFKTVVEVRGSQSENSDSGPDTQGLSGQGPPLLLHQPSRRTENPNQNPNQEVAQKQPHHPVHRWAQVVVQRLHRLLTKSGDPNRGEGQDSEARSTSSEKEVTDERESATDGGAVIGRQPGSNETSAGPRRTGEVRVEKETPTISEEDLGPDEEPAAEGNPDEIPDGLENVPDPGAGSGGSGTNSRGFRPADLLATNNLNRIKACVMTLDKTSKVERLRDHEIGNRNRGPVVTVIENEQARRYGIAD